MITPEQIEKLIEIANPEGFYTRTWVADEHEIGIKGQGCIYGIERSNTWEYVMYPLFLQKCIEGINRSFLNQNNDRLFIEVTIESVDIWDADSRSIIAFYSYNERSNMDKIKEQALVYILEQLNK